MPASERLPPRRELNTARLLAEGELTVLGRIPDASNAVLYASVGAEGRRIGCVYKPVAGERPLWDFPDGTLARREAAAYEVCRALGWDLVPPTVLRDGPLGPGMCQEWVGADPLEDPDEGPGTTSPTEPPGEPGAAEGGADGPEVLVSLSPTGLVALLETGDPGPGWKAVGHASVPDESGGERPALLAHADDDRLRRTAVLDAVVNNADRKGGHLLALPDGALRVIDHGVTFHTDDKLRTLLWGWAGEPLPEEATRALRRLTAGLAEGSPLATRLAALLSAAELDALRKRAGALLAAGRHPLPGGDWPAIPWPPV
ncbi:SCO1664 family protein [Streptomyces alkaliterrae]|uniref:SCO1664 family protein n=1 Tax=Streptomyces alkaliterrae TaxID=2213162 RepID=A0A5P0YWK3_9ACTN|nr:SCO1664 family protein [Streptomyces alkaliterrae]MBB1252184.1 SCO1664 family protein [Streptomyces alkaliterrae]MBB1258239.1 SCO1664 family protein [Streptomyces alkaliterrae]MQS02869.1 SCO1664 family protein [Streptomyces alkaliterrae]